MNKEFQHLIETSTADELEEFIKVAEKKVAKKRKQEIRDQKKKEAKAEREKIAKLKDMAKELGVDVKIKSKAPSGSKSTTAVAYQHPDDKTLTWTGRGRKPLWVNDWEKQGGSLDDIKVD